MADALIRKLTRADELLLWRKRNGYEQLEASLIVGVGRTTYSRMENGKRPVSRRWGSHMRRWEPLKGDPPPTLAERLYLTRKRRFWITLDMIAQALGATRPTVLRWEREADYRIRDFWRHGGGWQDGGPK